MKSMKTRILTFIAVSAMIQPLFSMDFNKKKDGYFGPSPEKIIAVYDHQKNQQSSVYKPNLELIGTINKEISSPKTMLAIEKDPCSICLETLAQNSSPALHLPACNYKHWFHRECIKNWNISGSAEAHNCPTCKQPYTIPLTLSDEKKAALTTIVYNGLTKRSTVDALKASCVYIAVTELLCKIIPYFFHSTDAHIAVKAIHLCQILASVFYQILPYLEPDVSAKFSRKSGAFLMLYALLLKAEGRQISRELLNFLKHYTTHLLKLRRA